MAYPYDPSRDTPVEAALRVWDRVEDRGMTPLNHQAGYFRMRDRFTERLRSIDPHKQSLA